MEYRKLISFGKSSFVVSLPKSWIKQNKLKKGDLIHFEDEGNNLVIKKKEEESKDKPSKPKRRENLEDTLGGEKAPRVLEHQFGDYIARLSQQPVKELYTEMSRINRAVEDKGYINAAEERRVEYLNSAMERKLEDVNAGKYSFTEDVAQSASLIQQIGSSLRDVYQRGKGRKGNEMYR